MFEEKRADFDMHCGGPILEIKTENNSKFNNSAT